MGETGKNPGSGFVNPLMEHLTTREMEVLVLLAQDLTAREIADKLTIAPTSAKWHIQQIYAKLGVHNRKKAIQRARELDLLVDSAIPPKWAVPRHNLPRQLTCFIGRENEIEQVRVLLTEHPLVTLTGSGGVGKTRLCLQVAGEILDQYRDGVWLVELSTITDPDLLEHTVAGVFGLREGSEQPIYEILFNFLRNRQALIILDNCEHLLDAVAQLASKLLNDCQRVSLMASSREALGVPGETIYSVPSMCFPDQEEPTDILAFKRYEAIQLFVERAQAALPGFEVMPENVKALTQICKRLDGIPLSIELAAARMNTLTTEQLDSRLDHAFRLLTGGSRTVLPRQQTMRATIDWSYQLLYDDEQALLRNLSVFTGGCDLEAAEEVCGGEDLEREAILDFLSSLVSKSMVIADRQQGADTRYHLLETVRQYAREKLFDHKESEALRDQHLAYYMNLAERAEPELRSAGRLVWTKRIKGELGNIRAALDWAFQNPTRVESGYRLAGGIGFRIMSSFGIARNWIDLLRKGLNIGEGYLVSSLLKTRIYNLLGWLHFYSEDQTTKATWFEKSISTCRSIGEEANADLSWALWGFADAITQIPGEHERVLEYLEESVSVARSMGSAGIWYLALALFFLSVNEYYLKDSLNTTHQMNIIDDDTWYEHSLQSRECFLLSGDRWGSNAALSVLGVYEYLIKENYSQARKYWEECLVLTEEVDDTLGSNAFHIFLGVLCRKDGNYEGAIQHHCAGLEVSISIGLETRMRGILSHLALDLVLRGSQNQYNQDDYLRAVTLISFAEHSPKHIYDYRADPKLIAQALESAKEVLGERMYNEAWEKGMSLSLDEAVNLALETGGD